MEAISLYNNVLKEVAAQEKVLFIDVLDVIGDQDLEDGMHPTAEGHEKMFVRIRDVLIEKKII
ncbi:TPA: hypothetical protein DCZ39_05565 [Patescibacteria group bacterium]|nr:hypothetical protein [Candidatus Gracilibacteria bacterium]